MTSIPVNGAGLGSFATQSLLSILSEWATTDAGLDSLDELDRLCLAADLEDEFGVLLPDDAALEWSTIAEVIASVEAAMVQKERNSG